MGSLCSDLTDEDALTGAFVTTYDPRSKSSPQTLRERYHRVSSYTADHPDKGSTAVASALGLPRSQIRPWVDSDSRPDCVHGIETLTERGWLPETWDAPEARGLNALVATAFTTGSINRQFVPRWVVDDTASRTMVTRAMDFLAIRPHQVATDPAEIEPAADRSVLGRVLVASGAPKGTKNPDTVSHLPPYPANAPTLIRREFAQTYCRARGYERTNPRTVAIREDRSADFRHDVAGLCRSLVSEAGTVSTTDYAR